MFQICTEFQVLEMKRIIIPPNAAASQRAAGISWCSLRREDNTNTHRAPRQGRAHTCTLKSYHLHFYLVHRRRQNSLESLWSFHAPRKKNYTRFFTSFNLRENRSAAAAARNASDDSWSDTFHKIWDGDMKLISNITQLLKSTIDLYTMIMHVPNYHSPQTYHGVCLKTIILPWYITKNHYNQIQYYES